MNARERVRAVINGKLPDHIPCGLGGCETAGMHVVTYDKLQEVLGVKYAAPRMDTFMCNAVFEKEVLEAMGGDILLVSSPRMCGAPLWGKDLDACWKEQQLWNRTIRVAHKEQFMNHPDGSVSWGRTDNICPPGGYFFDCPEGADFTAEFDYPALEDYHPSHELPEELLRNLEDTAKQLYETTEFSLCMGETITDLQILPGGMVGAMVLMMEEPDVMKGFLEKSLEAAVAQLKQLDQAVGKYVDILSIAHDFGDNRGITIGEDLWREIYKPYYYKLFHEWHAITRMKVNLHSCGSIEAILGDLTECGVDIYNPVQIAANNMSPESLKKRFGKDIVFWGGGYDTQLNHPADSYQTVYDRTSSNIRAFAKDGGYIFAGVHNLTPDVPEHHLRAMLDAWKDNRDYV